MIVSKIALLLNAMDRDSIRGWFEYCRDDSFHFGGAAIEILEEQAIVAILSATPEHEYCRFSEEQVAIINGWMEKAITRRYGSARVVTPPERALLEKLRSLGEIMTTAQDENQ